MSGQQRDMVFCHECENEWYRDEHGLSCPECHSDFTEIIEANHDPRDDHMNILDDADADHILHHHPWGDQDAPDPDDGDIDEVHYASGGGPGGYTVHRTIRGSWPPSRNSTPGVNQGDAQQQPGHNDPLNGTFNSFYSMVQNIMGGNATPNTAQRADNTRQPGAGRTPGGGTMHFATFGTPGNGGMRFTYASGSTRLNPRDPNGPQPQGQPVDELNNILGSLFSQMTGAPPGHPMHDQIHHGGGGGGGMPGFGASPFPPDHPFAAMHNHDHDHARAPGGGMPMMNPFSMLFGSLLNPASAQHGDAVYTQEALDAVISRLMEQNATGTAPGPASQETIQSLPKVKVTQDMLGDDERGKQGKGECSICMDEVTLGDEVVRLPDCGHWFHGECVGSWLGEHNTCPHCRKGVSDPKVPSQQQQQPGANASASSSHTYPRFAPGFAGGQGHGQGQNIPGSFDNPWVVDDSSPPPPGQRDYSGQGNGQGNSTSGGIGERVRNLFGRGAGSSS